MTTEQREIGNFEQFPGIQGVADEAMHSAITILKERPNAIEVAEENEEISNFPRLKSFFTGGGLKAKYYQTQQKFRSSVYSWRSDSLRQILPLMGLARLTDQPGIEAYFEAEITAGFEETTLFPELRDSSEWEQGIFALESLVRVIDDGDAEFDYDIFGAESNLAELAVAVRGGAKKNSPELVELERRLNQSIENEPPQHQKVYRYFAETLLGKNEVDRTSPIKDAHKAFKYGREIREVLESDSLRGFGITGQDAINAALQLINVLKSRNIPLFIGDGGSMVQSNHDAFLAASRLIAFGASGGSTREEVLEAINSVFSLQPVDKTHSSFKNASRSIDPNLLADSQLKLNTKTAGVLFNLAELADEVGPDTTTDPITRYSTFKYHMDIGSNGQRNFNHIYLYQEKSETRIGTTDNELEISDRDFRNLNNERRLQIFQTLAIDGKTDDLLRLVDKLEPEDRAHGLFVIAMTQVVAGTGELINPDLSMDINKPEQRNPNRQAVREGLGALARLLPGVEAEDFNGVAALRASERRLDIDTIIQRIKLATTEDGSDIAKDTAKLYEEIGSCSDLTAKLKEELTNELTARILEVETDQDLLVNEPLEVEESTEVEG